MSVTARPKQIVPPALIGSTVVSTVQLIDSAFNHADLPFDAICGDYPDLWSGAEFWGTAGKFRAYTDDTDIVVVAFGTNGWEIGRARLAGLPVAVVVAVLREFAALVTE